MAETYMMVPSSATADRTFETEENILRARMMEADIGPALLAAIEKMAFSRQAKNSLQAVVVAHFDKNAVLANNNSIDLRMLKLDAALNRAKLCMTRPDVMNPNLVTTMHLIKISFGDFVSRSYMGGERKMQGERKNISEAIVTPREYQEATGQPAQSQNRGKLDILGRMFGGHQ